MSQNPSLPPTAKAPKPFQPKPSQVEGVKQASALLRGSIKETLNSDSVKFSEDEYNLLKFHGTYQGYDRDSRDRAEAAEGGKEVGIHGPRPYPGGTY